MDADDFGGPEGLAQLRPPQWEGAGGRRVAAI